MTTWICTLCGHRVVSDGDPTGRPGMRHSRCIDPGEPWPEDCPPMHDGPWKRDGEQMEMFQE